MADELIIEPQFEKNVKQELAEIKQITEDLKQEKEAPVMIA